jgi:hypothetical protein
MSWNIGGSNSSVILWIEVIWTIEDLRQRQGTLTNKSETIRPDSVAHAVSMLLLIIENKEALPTLDLGDEELGMSNVCSVRNGNWIHVPVEDLRLHVDDPILNRAEQAMVVRQAENSSPSRFYENLNVITISLRE